jgi:hypothetical protein
MKIIALVLASVALLSPQVSRAQLSGPQYLVTVGGLPMSCTSNAGVPVAIFSDPSLNNIGIATTAANGVPMIILNPNVVAQYSPIVKQWWFAHECAHHALGPYNSEPNADCFGAKQLVQYGILNNLIQLQAFAYELANLPGSLITGHMPGPVRAMAIANCAIGFS